MLVVELLSVEDNIATVKVDGSIQRYEVQIGLNDYIEIEDSDGVVYQYDIEELIRQW